MINRELAGYRYIGFRIYVYSRSVCTETVLQVASVCNLLHSRLVSKSYT